MFQPNYGFPGREIGDVMQRPPQTFQPSYEQYLSGYQPPRAMRPRMRPRFGIGQNMMHQDSPALMGQGEAGGVPRFADTGPRPPGIPWGAPYPQYPQYGIPRPRPLRRVTNQQPMMPRY